MEQQQSQLRRARGRTRKKEYNATLKRAEKELAAVQQAYQQQLKEYLETQEKHMILAEMIDMQERAAAVYEKQQRWLAAGGPTEACPEQDTPLTAAPDRGARWAIYLLETATWEQQQLAMSMSREDWVARQRQYCADLRELMEINSKCPDIQSMMLGSIGAAVHPPPARYPAVYLTSSSIGGAAAGDEGLQAGDMIVHMLKTTGVLMFVGSLHSCPAMMEATGCNLLTGEVCQPPHMHWVSVAQRVKFTRQQKLHFKLALQAFARQAKAAAAKGLTILQETPSYAFLLACETIAARQLSSSSSGDGPGAPAADGAQDMPAQHAGAAAAGPASATAAAAAAAEARAPSSGAGGSSMTAEGMPGSNAPAVGQLTPGTEPDMMVDSPAEGLMRQMNLYLRSIMNLNIFLADTLTLDQALLMHVAAFPFWPMLSAVAEAAIQLPDDGQEESGDGPQAQGVQLLMRRRRDFMQQVHSEWLGGLRDPQ